MRRAALVIGCSDSDLSARIASDRSGGGGGVKSGEGVDQSDGQVLQSRPEDRTTTAKIAPPPKRPSRTWEHGDCLSVTPEDFTFNLVINNGNLYCVMCSSDHIERRMNMYRDEVGRVLSMGDLEDEDRNSDNN